MCCVCDNGLRASRCSILIKVCVLLRNRFQEIRDVARGTLVKIIETLGFRYLQYLLKEMQSVLVKGYQVTDEEQKGQTLTEGAFATFSLQILCATFLH